MSTNNIQNFLKNNLYKNIHNPEIIYEEPALKFNTPCKNDFIGIEIELENHYGDYINNPYWTYKEDGSLRNHGIEYVTTKGIQVKHCREALEQLFSAIPDATETTSRTSIHIHMNVLDLTLEELYDFLITYTILEKSLYNFAGPKRYYNIYCVPIQESSFIQSYLHHTKLDTKLRHLILQWNKYSGLNLATIQQFGTIEFRHLKGTLDIEKILNWIRLVFSIKQFVQDSTKESIHVLIQLYKDSFPIEQIFGEYTKLIVPKNIKESLLFVKTNYYFNNLLIALVNPDTISQQDW